MYKRQAQRRADAGRPRKAERKAQQKCGNRPHGKAVEPQGKPVFLLDFIGASENAELIKSEKDHEDAAETGKPDPVSGKEFSERGKAQTQKKEGKADAQNEKQGVEHYFFTGIGNSPVRLHFFGAARKIADVERDERKDAGREKAQDALQEHGKRRNARFDVEIHAKNPF